MEFIECFASKSLSFVKVSQYIVSDAKIIRLMDSLYVRINKVINVVFR